MAERTTTCMNCGRPALSGKRGPLPTRCSECRDPRTDRFVARYRNDLEFRERHREKQRERYGAVAPRVRQCPTCGGAFLGRSRRRYCSVRCRDKSPSKTEGKRARWRRQQRRRKLRALGVLPLHNPAETHPAYDPRPPGQRDRVRWDALRQVVFERDRFRCQIQGPRCTGRAEHCDHVVPRRVAPHLEWEFSNLQAACAVCNRAKQDLTTSMGGTAAPSREW